MEASKKWNQTRTCGNAKCSWIYDEEHEHESDGLTDDDAGEAQTTGSRTTHSGFGFGWSLDFISGWFYVRSVTALVFRLLHFCTSQRSRATTAIFV